MAEEINKPYTNNTAKPQMQKRKAGNKNDRSDDEMFTLTRKLNQVKEAKQSKAKEPLTIMLYLIFSCNARINSLLVYIINTSKATHSLSYAFPTN